MESTFSDTTKNLVSKSIDALIKFVPIIEKDKLPNGLFDTLCSMFYNGIYLDKERLNILLSYWHLPPMSSEFYGYYFKPRINPITDLKESINRFIKDALWHYGDLQNAYSELIKKENISIYFKSKKFDCNEFAGRLSWDFLENIEPSKRGYLGYVSGERPKKEQTIVNKAEKIIEVFEKNYNKLKNESNDMISEFILNELRDKYPDIDSILKDIDTSTMGELDLFSSSKLDENKLSLNKHKQEIEQTISLIEELKKKGTRNQERYLRNIESIDIYVATSMRNDKDYIEMAQFVEDTFNNKDLKVLNLRYFDPTLCYCESRIDKGIIECLLVRSAKVTIYCAQVGDTFGKDSELAATIIQGKPAIVYVPNNPEFDERANVFKEFHPLGLQVGLYDGVARGVIVVRTPQECSEILQKILTNTLETDISYEQHGIVLKERITKSVVRVMTGWGMLSKTFWNNFDRTKSPKPGIIV